MGNTSECQFSNVVHMVLPLHNAYEINSQNTNFLYALQRLNGPRTHMRTNRSLFSLSLSRALAACCHVLDSLCVLVNNNLIASVCVCVCESVQNLYGFNGMRHMESHRRNAARFRCGSTFHTRSFGHCARRLIYPAVHRPSSIQRCGETESNEK